MKFPLKNLLNVQTEKWHTAYYGTKLGAVRRILDKGQPLTKGEQLFVYLLENKIQSYIAKLSFYTTFALT